MRTKIARLMALKGVGNTTIAKTLGISDVVFCAWKRGRVVVPPGRRKQLAEALGVKVEDILDERGLALLAVEEEEF